MAKAKKAELVELRMKTLCAGPDGVRQIGSTHRVPADEAEQLVDGGYAELVVKEGNEDDQGDNAGNGGTPDAL